MIVTVVVTFNRKEDLVINIQHQLMQTQLIDKIIVVDNASTDGTYKYLQELGFLSDGIIDYVLLEENLGGAGGFEAGVRHAYKIGADYIVMMDDDGYMLHENTLNELVKYIPQQEDFMLNSLVTCSEGLMTFGLGYGSEIKNTVDMARDGYVMNKINPFNGTFISRKLVDKIGFPKGEFFIYGDERDYQERAIDSGAFVATVVSSMYYHPARKCSEKKFFLGKEFENNHFDHWRVYYRVRNEVFSIKTKSVVGAYKFLARRIICLLLFSEDDKLGLLNFILHGFFDGMNGQLGKRVVPGQRSFE